MFLRRGLWQLRCKGMLVSRCVGVEVWGLSVWGNCGVWQLWCVAVVVWGSCIVRELW